MIKIWLKNIYSSIFKIKNSSSAIIGNKCVFGLNSRIINKTKQANKVIIKNNVMMHGSLITEGNGIIEIDDFVNIRRNTYIGSCNYIRIKRGTIISNNVTIMDNNNHPISALERIKMVESGWGNKFWSWKNSKNAPITIGKNVWIGQNTRINKGVTIGDNSIIGANSVVTKDIPENCIAAGNPAKIVKQITEEN